MKKIKQQVYMSIGVFVIAVIFVLTVLFKNGYFS
jgi:hypothetical protein